MPPKPRRITVDGHELVVLTSAAYESLAALRRQAGAQATRVRALCTQLDQLSSFVDRLERAVADLPNCPPTRCPACVRADTGCTRTALVAALASRTRRDGDRGT